MFRLTSDITIADKYRFLGAIEAETVSSWDDLTDTATLVFPHQIAWKDEKIALGNSPILRKGDPLSISFGLDGENAEWLNGFITKINAGIPTKVEAQDAMFLLKKGEFVKSYKSGTLKGLLTDMLKGIVPFEVTADFELGQIRSVGRPTPAQWLERLRTDYFVRFFFRNGTLYAGLPIVPKLQTVHKIIVIQNDLEYIRKDDVKILLKGVIIKTDNSKVEIEVGDKDGEIRTINKYNISEQEMRRFLEQEIAALRYEGYRGSFTTFIRPDIQHGDIVTLPTLYNLEHDGRYIVKRVTKTVQGLAARQRVELERRIG